jgi:hypothetical protein
MKEIVFEETRLTAGVGRGAIEGRNLRDFDRENIES